MQFTINTTVFSHYFNWNWRKLKFATNYCEWCMCECLLTMPRCKCSYSCGRSVRVLIFLKYISRDFMIFHCIVSAFCAEFFEKFEWNTYGFSCVWCTVRTLLRRRIAPFEHPFHIKDVPHSAVVAAFFISSFFFFSFFPFCSAGHKSHI